MKTRTTAFIDSQNLNLGVQNQGWKLDFRKFRIYLKERYGVEKAYLFIGMIEGNKELYDALKEYGYELVFKPTVESEAETKGNVDAELVLWAAAVEYPNYDKAVIVSGDGDFYCLVKFLKERNKLGWVVVPNRKRFSRLLGEFQDQLAFINNLKSKLGYRVKRRRMKVGKQEKQAGAKQRGGLV